MKIRMMKKKRRKNNLSVTCARRFQPVMTFLAGAGEEPEPREQLLSGPKP